MKFAVSSYSFSQYIRDGRIDQLGCIAKAKEMGFDAIEFIDLTPPDSMTEAQFAEKIRNECERAGITISNYTIAGDLLNGGEREIERLKGKVDIASILGTHSMRHDAAWGFKENNPRNQRGFDSVVNQLADGCRAVTEYAAEKGIRTMVENHGYFAQDSDRVECLINTVARNNFGWLFDMGNFLCADEDPAVACGKAAPYVFYAHAKDFIVKNGSEPDPGEGFFRSRAANYLRGTIIGHGAVPVLSCLRILKSAGYDGYIGVEFEGMEDCVHGIRIGLENLKKYEQMI